MWRLGLIYTRERPRHHGKSIALPKEKETGSVALFKGRSLILIGSLPLFQPGVPVLEFVSSAEDYGESETGIIPRNKVNYLCRDLVVHSKVLQRDTSEIRRSAR